MPKSSQHQHHYWHTKIRECFRGRLPGDELGPLHAHLRDCEECRQLYQEFSNAERALGETPPGEPLSEVERDRVASRLFASEARPERRRELLAILAVATAAILVAVVAVPHQQAKTSRGDFQVRGSGGGPLSHGVSLRALRVRQEGGHPAVTDLAAGETVHPGDVLSFAYTNLTDFDTVRVIVRGSEGHVETRPDFALTRGAEDEILGESFAIPRDWPPGELTIVALFFRGEAPSLELGGDVRGSDASAYSVRVVQTRIVEDLMNRPNERE